MKYAIKIINYKDLDRVLNRLMREAEALFISKHQYVVGYYDVRTLFYSVLIIIIFKKARNFGKILRFLLIQYLVLIIILTLVKLSVLDRA